MNRIKSGYTAEHCFAAIKLIEQLYKDGHIPDYMFRNILDEYDGIIDTSKFSVYKENENDEKEEIV